MIRHIVLLRFKTDAASDAIAAWHQADRTLCEGSPEVMSFTLGRNLGEGPNHHDAALVADFEDMAAFRRYVGSAGHASYVADNAVPVVDTLAAIQHEV